MAVRHERGGMLTPMGFHPQVQVDNDGCAVMLLNMSGVPTTEGAYAPDSTGYGAAQAEGGLLQPSAVGIPHGSPCWFTVVVR